MKPSRPLRLRRQDAKMNQNHNSEEGLDTAFELEEMLGLTEEQLGVSASLREHKQCVEPVFGGNVAAHRTTL